MWYYRSRVANFKAKPLSSRGIKGLYSFALICVWVPSFGGNTFHLGKMSATVSDCWATEKGGVTRVARRTLQYETTGN